MTHRKQLLITTAALALAPFAAQAAAISWTGATSNAWETANNWNTKAVPTTTSAVTIATTTNNPVQLNSNVSLNGTGGALTIGTAPAPGTPLNVLNINTGDTLTMGTKAVSLLGGSITGLGTLSTSGSISGYGTVSSLISGSPSFSANSTDGTTYTFVPSFKNGTPGTPLTIIGASLTNTSFAISNHGDFNFQGVTLTTPTLTGVSTNLNAGPTGGNNTYGLLSFTGAASTVVGKVSNTNYQQFDINGTTLHLNNFSLSNSWATNVPPFFVVNAGGTLDNTVGNSNMNGFMATILNGGTISNSGGGTFTFAGQINGNGTLSGPANLTGGVIASGGTLVIDGTKGAGITAASAGWSTAGGASDVLDLKGTINFAPFGTFPAAPSLSPGGATLQLDGATINTPSGKGTLQTGSGTVNVASGVNTLNGSFIPNGSNGTVADYKVATGATLSLQNLGSGPAITGHNFTMAKGAMLTTGPGNNGISLSGNFSYQQTDTIHGWTNNGTAGLGPNLTMTGGTSATPTTLEAGSVKMVYYNNPGAFVDNFALSSLSLSSAAYVGVVDQFQNATPSGWVSGSEVLYLDGLFGVSTGTIPTLNLDGIEAFLSNHGFLYNGLYTDANGGEVRIIGASPAPEPAAMLLFGSGLAGLALVRLRRRRR
jgi:fibronectin-binding autotransporter adhesin